MFRKVAVGIISCLMAMPTVSAEKKKKLGDIFVPLDKQPMVRRRKLLVRKRFELTPAFESTVSAEYRHTYSFGLKAEYHLTDQLSIGAVGFYGLSRNTGLTNKILDTLPASPQPWDVDPEPSRAQYEQHLNEMPLHGAAYVSWTPWYGKMSAFGVAFLSFDFYFQAGLAVAQLKADCDPSICSDTMPEGDPANGIPSDNDPRNDFIQNDGLRLGLYLGGGIHVFMTDWLALDLTVRSYLFDDNPSGLDTNFSRTVTGDDSSFQNHLFLGVGFSVMLPTTVKRTD